MSIAKEPLEVLNRSHADERTQRKRDSERFRRELAAPEPQETSSRTCSCQLG